MADFTLPSEADPIKALDPDAEAAKVAGSASAPSDDVPSKKRGPKPGSKNRKKRTSKGISETNLATAQIANGIFFETFKIIGGEDAAPEPDEIKSLDRALNVFLDQYPEIKIPPAAVLALLYGKFIVSKAGKPTVWERIKLTGNVLTGKIFAAGRRVKSFFTRKKRVY